MVTQSKLLIRLRGKTAVLIDWANVYGWEKSLGRGFDPRKLHYYLKSYKDIKQISFYFGTDKHPKSKKFLTRVRKIGFRVVTKPVKYILVATVKGEKVFRRKCDFDMETCIDVHKAISQGMRVSFSLQEMEISLRFISY